MQEGFQPGGLPVSSPLPLCSHTECMEFGVMGLCPGERGFGGYDDRLLSASLPPRCRVQHHLADVTSTGMEIMCGSRDHLPQHESLDIKAIFAGYNYH